jgi:hypothetical protein
MAEVSVNRECRISDRASDAQRPNWTRGGRLPFGPDALMV